MGKIFGVIFAILFFCGATYGIYWCTKTISYKIFYEDMVRAEIVEMVRPEALREE
jgi:hypothetical protein